jgi:hypothetical protein
MHGRDDIVIATSIPPSISRRDNGVEVGDAYQRRCVDSWAAAGLRVISINVPHEIAALSSRYPTIEFIAADRDAKAILGRATPFLSDLLDALARQSAPIAGIINADICLQPGQDWIPSIVRALDREAMLIARRNDVPTLNGAEAKVYAAGFDCFFFKRSWIPGIARHRFALGLPWWDYWLPMAFAFKGLEIVVLKQSPALHLAHPDAYNDEIWNLMAREFVDFIVAAAAEPGSDPRERLAAIVAYCRILSEQKEQAPHSAPATRAHDSSLGWLWAWRDWFSRVEKNPSFQELASMCFTALLRSATI